MGNNKTFQLFLWIFVFGITFDSLIFDYEFEMAAALSLVECAIDALISYVNVKLLIPRVLNKKGTIPYITGVVIFFLILFIPYYNSELGFYLLDLDPLRVVISFTLNFVIFILLSFMFWKVNQYEFEKKRNLELSNQKLQAELQLLKSQVSPHFLFNTLNNIYSLSLTKHDNAPLMIEKLSDLLRYIIYEGKQELVPLEREEELLRNYTELQLLKKPKGEKNIKLTVKGVVPLRSASKETPSGQWVTPLLLINIVENCFKHGDVTYNSNGMISIDLTVEGNRLHFRTVNSYSPSNKESGIGLDNVKQQLEHYYPGRHQFEIESTTDKFVIDLQIDLTQ